MQTQQKVQCRNLKVFGNSHITGNSQYDGDVIIQGKLMVNGRDICEDDNEPCIPVIDDLTYCNTSIVPNDSTLTIGTENKPWKEGHFRNLNGCLDLRHECLYVPFQMVFRNINVAMNFSNTSIATSTSIDECLCQTDMQAIYCEMDSPCWNHNNVMVIRIKDATETYLNGLCYAKPIIIQDMKYGWCLYKNKELTIPCLYKNKEDDFISDNCGVVCANQKKMIILNSVDEEPISINNVLRLEENKCCVTTLLNCHQTVNFHSDLIINQHSCQKIIFMDDNSMGTLKWSPIHGFNVNCDMAIDGNLTVKGQIIAENLPGSGGCSISKVVIESNSTVICPKTSALELCVRQSGVCSASLVSTGVDPGKEITLIITEIPENTTFHLEILDMLKGKGIKFTELGQTVKLMRLTTKKWAYTSGLQYDIKFD